MMFSEQYGRLRAQRDSARDGPAVIQERVLQCVWYDQTFVDANLCTHDGRPLRVLSPGWWNHSEGPDFQGAQIEIGGTLHTGDVEVHVDHASWKQHGHHLDSRYDEVILEVVLSDTPPKSLATTSMGRAVPCLLLRNYLEGDARDLADRAQVSDAFEPDEAEAPVPAEGGQCAAMAEAYGAEHVLRLLMLAGEWRLLSKARALRERIERAGPDQAIYEAFLSACGFSRYKHHFRVIAQQLPHERARQLARQDPLLIEAAFLQLGGLLPDSLPPGTTAVPHFARLRALRRDSLPGLRSLPLVWKRTGVRPNNYPERRLAGAARFIARTTRDGLAEALEQIWRADLAPVERRRAFEGLFPGPMGFWASHCCWTGKELAHPIAPLGGSRIHAIIGNVFVTAALAQARQTRDRYREETILEFFAALPKEAENHVVRRMIPRVFSDIKIPKLDFRIQQGLLQLYQDWCQTNPSCHHCAIIPFLDVGYNPKLVR